MKLPEIPDSAIRAAVNVAGTRRKQLEAAWPHLYAAALRHAARAVWDAQLHDKVVDAGAVLHLLADEAEPT